VLRCTDSESSSRRLRRPSTQCCFCFSIQPFEECECCDLVGRRPRSDVTDERSRLAAYSTMLTASIFFVVSHVFCGVWNSISWCPGPGHRLVNVTSLSMVPEPGLDYRQPSDCMQNCRYLHTSTSCRPTCLFQHYTVSQKNDTDIAHYNFNAHQPILVIFG